MRPAFYLEFDNPAGTDRARWVTFRTGNAWYRRLKRGRVVLLADSKTRQVYGKAKVLELDAGFADVMLAQYAWLSHLEECPPWIDGNEGESKDTPMGRRLTWVDEHRNAAAERRYTAMRRRYGPQRFDYFSTVTVIILKRTA